MRAPEFFYRVRGQAKKDWDLLHERPDIAAPWYQLLSQVKSPRHVISELLQNADDAGATEASVRLEDRTFIFEHDGQDFSEADFLSLCRFGYSNKRTLHTIGFRGIGFKSTFSLADTVELRTPTLSVRFNERQFTLPEWVAAAPTGETGTRIIVEIVDVYRLQEMTKSLREWLDGAVSLLFFKNIRRLHINDADIHWRCLGPGPVPGSEWMTADDDGDSVRLSIRDQAESFPPDCVDEIQRERLINAGETLELPPCSIDLVIGEPGRLFVVLPTGVSARLPFAINAPFIQDPARLKIKDPETSPTNRWLLTRAGTFAGALMLNWLESAALSLIERAKAYVLLPESPQEHLEALEVECFSIVQSALHGEVRGQRYVFTSDETLVPVGGAIAIPDDVSEVWPGPQTSVLFDAKHRPLLSQVVPSADRAKLFALEAVDEISKDDVLTIIRSEHLPRPKSWDRLHRLWRFVAASLPRYYYNAGYKDLRIVPVQGKEVLYAAQDVVRLGESKLLQSDADWEFLSSHLLVLNQNWTRFLAEHRREVESGALQEGVEEVYRLLAVIGLESTSEASLILGSVARTYFKAQDGTLDSDCVRLAQIFAKLDISINEAFRFATADEVLHPVSDVVVYDRAGSVESLMPSEWCEGHLLHHDYFAAFRSCTKDEWNHWALSGKSGLFLSAPPSKDVRRLSSRAALEQELLERGCRDKPAYEYKTNIFVLEDWDFAPDYWDYWEALFKDDSSVYGRVMASVLEQTTTFWSLAQRSRVWHVSSGNTRKEIVAGPVPAAWVVKFRGLPCLRDTSGFYRKPADLMRRTQETEPFLGVEPFIEHSLDSEATRPLLGALGVHATAAKPQRIMDRLRALSLDEKPPVDEVDKWYRRLNAITATCPAEELSEIRQAFAAENLVLTQSSLWTSTVGVFLNAGDEDVPEAAVIRSSVRDLELWRRLHVADRPTAELAIAWLSSLPSGQSLGGDVKRVRALLARHAARIWNECKHWINLLGEWTPIGDLRFGLAMQSLTKWGHLHDWVKRQTADFQNIPADALNAKPLDEMPSLSSQISDCISEPVDLVEKPEHKPWILALGSELSKVMFEEIAETNRVRALGERLASTKWQTVTHLEVTPYINGIPAGTARQTDVLWSGRMLYAKDKRLAELSRAICSEFGGVFNRADIADVIKLCFDRDNSFISECIQANFTISANGTERTTYPAQSILEAGASGPLPVIESLDANGALSPRRHAISPFNVTGTLAVEKAAGVDAEPTEEDGSRPRARDLAVERKANILERFALSRGFRKDSDNRFFRDDGAWLAKASGGIFPWELRSAKGELVRRYWAKHHCLDSEPLELPAEVWAMLDRVPSETALVLVDANEDPIELLGTEAMVMLAERRLSLHPAAYRLVQHANMGARLQT